MYMTDASTRLTTKMPAEIGSINKKPTDHSVGFLYQRPFQTGGVLLSHTLRHSTIDAESFHGRVRNGNGWFTSRYNHQTEKALMSCEFRVLSCE